MLGDPSAHPGTFSSGKLVARRQRALVVPSADERGERALDLLPLTLQGSPFLGEHGYLLTSRTSKTGAAPQHANSAQRHDPAGPIRPLHRIPQPMMRLVIDGDCQLKGSHQHEKEAQDEACTSAHSTPGSARDLPR